MNEVLAASDQAEDRRGLDDGDVARPIARDVLEFENAFEMSVVELVYR